MVRHITGALLAVGEGKISVADIKTRLELGAGEPAGGWKAAVRRQQAGDLGWGRGRGLPAPALAV